MKGVSVGGVLSAARGAHFRAKRGTDTTSHRICRSGRVSGND